MIPMIGVNLTSDDDAAFIGLISIIISNYLPGPKRKSLRKTKAWG